MAADPLSTTFAALADPARRDRRPPRCVLGGGLVAQPGVGAGFDGGEPDPGGAGFGDVAPAVGGEFDGGAGPVIPVGVGGPPAARTPGSAAPAARRRQCRRPVGADSDDSGEVRAELPGRAGRRWVATLTAVAAVRLDRGSSGMLDGARCLRASLSSCQLHVDAAARRAGSRQASRCPFRAAVAAPAGAGARSDYVEGSRDTSEVCSCFMRIGPNTRSCRPNM